MNADFVLDRGERLSAYLEGALEPGERERVERELEADPETAREMAELQCLLSAMSAMPDLEAPPGFCDRVTRKIRRRRWLEDSSLHTTLTLIFQILSIVVVVGIAAAYMLAHTESDDRRVMQIERDVEASSPTATPDSDSEATP